MTKRDSQFELFISEIPGVGDTIKSALYEMAGDTTSLNQNKKPSVSVMLRRLAFAYLAAEELGSHKELSRELEKILKIGDRKATEHRYQMYARRGPGKKHDDNA